MSQVDDIESDSKSASKPLIGERYDLHEIKFSTRSAEAHRAVRREDGAEFLLWALRYPLQKAGGAQERFNEHIEKLRESGVHHRAVIEYGITKGDKPFVVSPYDDLPSIIDSVDRQGEAEKRFIAAIRIVSGLHKKQIVLGDICGDSFVVLSHGRLELNSFLGTYDVDAAKTAMLPAVDTLRFMAPEQKIGANPDVSGDIYALGMLGYRLFTGAYPPSDSETIDSSVAPPSSVDKDVPIWVDDILGSCLMQRSDERYGSASEILNAIEQSISSGLPPGGVGPWSRRTLIVAPAKRDQKSSTRGQPQHSEIARRESQNDSPSKSPKGGGALEKAQAQKTFRPMRVLASLGFILGIFGIIFALAFFFFMDISGPGEEGIRQALSPYLDDADPELRELVNNLVASRSTLASRRQSLEQLAQRTDPLTYEMLVAVAQQATEIELRKATEQYLLQKLRSQKLTRAADVLRNWLYAVRRERREPSSTKAFILFFAATNPGRPMEDRKEALTRAYSLDPGYALELTAALALDTRDREEDGFVPVLRQLLSVHMGREDLGQKTAAALIVVDKTLSLVFGREISQLLTELPPSELAWALGELSKRGSHLLLDVADETLSRGVVPPYQSVFLRTLVDGGLQTPKEVRNALADAARNNIDDGDIAVLGRWYSTEADRPLLAICAIAKDDLVALSAFDTLAARSLVNEPARSLIDWVKRNYWSHRAQLVKAIGILGLGDVATDEELDYAFDSLMPFSGASLLNYVLRSGQSTLIIKALDRMASITPSETLLPLLKSENKQIRIAAVRGLEGRNNLHVLQSVIRSFEREKDEEVREEYRKHFWPVRDL